MAASAVKLFSRILILSSRQNSAFYNFYCLCDEKIDNGILFAGLVGVDNKYYDVGSESKLRGNIIFLLVDDLQCLLFLKVNHC